MVHNHTICPVIERYDQLWPHLTQYIQFWSIFDMCAWKGYIWLISPASGIYCIIVASTGPVRLVVDNASQLWSGISSLNELVHFKAELRDIGLVYQVIPCTTLWDKIAQISSKVAYNAPVFVTVPRYNRLGQYLYLFYHFWAVLSLSVMFDLIMIKVPGKRESGQQWSIIIQYEPLQRDMTIYGHIRHSISNSDQLSTGVPEKATYGLWRRLVADTAYYGIYWSRSACCRQC